MCSLHHAAGTTRMLTVTASTAANDAPRITGTIATLHKKDGGKKRYGFITSQCGQKAYFNEVRPPPPSRAAMRYRRCTPFAAQHAWCLQWGVGGGCCCCCCVCLYLRWTYLACLCGVRICVCVPRVTSAFALDLPCMCMWCMWCVPSRVISRTCSP